MSRIRWWIAGTIAGVIVAAVAGAVIWQDTHPPRADTVATVTPSLDRSIAGVVAATGDSAAVTVTGLVATASCSGGSVFTVTANLYTNPGSEGVLIDRIAVAVPASENPHRTAALGGGVSSLYANLGGGAQLQVIQLDRGWLAATAKSGCRSAPPSAASQPAPPATATADLGRALNALGSAPTAFHTDAVLCGTGQIVTASTVSGSVNLADLRAQLAKLPPAGAIVFTSPSDRVAWRAGNVSTVVAAADDGVHITAQQTQSC